MPVPGEKAYISGAITARLKRGETIAAVESDFKRTAAAAEREGYEAVMPVGFDPSLEGRNWSWYLSQDIPLVCGSQAIILRPDWRDSPGAKFELDVAERLGHAVMLYDPETDTIAPRPSVVHGANPKDLIGVRKVQLGLLPAAGKIYGALAMEDGAIKYQAYNWRTKKVLMSIYLDAMERHLLSLRDGEDLSADSKVPHLGNIIACASILADAIEGGFIVDDRPVSGPAARTLLKFEKDPIGRPNSTLETEEPVAGKAPRVGVPTA